MRPIITLLALFFLAPLSLADDGYQLWLAHDPLPKDLSEAAAKHLRAVDAPNDSPTQQLARKELLSALSKLLGEEIPSSQGVAQSGTVVLGTPASSPLVARAGLGDKLTAQGDEGFLIQSREIDGKAATLIAANSDLGTLYGVFAFLRLLEVGTDPGTLDLEQKPRFQRRLLNHWDNINGSIERGYAGRSLWNWNELPGTVDPRLADYARANASIGINGSVLNNVNSNAQSLTTGFLEKTAAIAKVFRPYGIKVYLSARFSAPMELDGFETADPLDPKVADWWKRKADEVYRIIPDFGGFLVKANSEGQPGPLTYGKTHADGANMLAKAIEPHGGIVMWRAFVYDPDDSDRIGQAYDAMKPLDGEFANNVLVQVKNGPLDFQPREPFHPLFGSMEESQIMPELQISQEYLGHSKQLAYLAPMWKEFFDADTFAEGKGSSVAKTIDGSIFDQKITAIAGVANTGSDRNWTGHPLAQANWYAYGRLAWNPDLGSDEIAREWISMTLTHDPQALATISKMLMESREAVVDYSMPLGLAHLMWEGHHYGPQPWCDHLPRPDWNPTYFHRAAPDGIGFDRTAKGSNAVSQYHPPVRDRFADPSTCPDEFLLWFHHLPWDHPMSSGRSLWDELALHYQRGVDWVEAARGEWAGLAGKIDPEIHTEVAEKLAIQERDAARWRDACLLYFQTFSKLPFPEGVDKPEKMLSEFRNSNPLRFPR